MFCIDVCNVGATGTCESSAFLTFGTDSIEVLVESLSAIKRDGWIAVIFVMCRVVNSYIIQCLLSLHPVMDIQP